MSKLWAETSFDFQRVISDLHRIWIVNISYELAATTTVEL